MIIWKKQLKILVLLIQIINKLDVKKKKLISGNEMTDTNYERFKKMIEL